MKPSQEPVTEHVEVSNHRFVVRLACNEEEVERALRLRYEVFAEELGFQHAYVDGQDRDMHDAQFDHLLVFQRSDGQLVGTYRLQTWEMAQGAEGFVSALEFYLRPLPETFLQDAIEIGRSCIMESFRKGWVLYLLWKGVAQYTFRMGKRFLFGCCSLNSQDKQEGAQLWRFLQEEGHVHPTISIKPQPKYRFDTSGAKSLDSEVLMPDLMRLYLQLGAKVCGPPAFDSDYKTIDFFIVLDTAALDQKTIEKYLR